MYYFFLNPNSAIVKSRMKRKIPFVGTNSFVLLKIIQYQMIKVQRFFVLILAILSLLGAVIVETNYYSPFVSQRHFSEFQDVIIEKQSFAESFCTELSHLPADASFSEFELFKSKNSRWITSQAVQFYVYEGDSCVYWSSNRTAGVVSILSHERPLFFSGNAWYLTHVQKVEGRSYIVLLFIKSQYSFKNEYLQNNYHPDFNMNAAVTIFDEPCDEGYSITSEDGTFLLSLSKIAGRDENKDHCFLAIFLYLLGIAFFLYFCHQIAQQIQSVRYRDCFNVFLFFAIVLLRWWMYEGQIPYICYETKLFSGDIFHMPLAPSLGDLLINVMALVYFVRQLTLRIEKSHCDGHITLLRVFFILCTLAFWSLFVIIFEALIYNSSINLELFNLLNSNFLSLVTYCIIAVFLFLYFVLLRTFANIPSIVGSRKAFFLITLAGILGAFVLHFVGYMGDYWLNPVFYCITLVVLLLAPYCGIRFFGQFNKYALLVLSVLFVENFIAYAEQIRVAQQKKDYAVALANEHDYVAETFLSKVYADTRSDETLRSLMLQSENKDVAINNYLQKKYFSGFLKQYELECTVCQTDEDVQSPNHLANCDRYFGSMLSASGKSISDTNYYFVNSQDGNITYFDSIRFVLPGGVTSKLYIELHSNTNTQDYGYPAILMEQQLPSQNTLDFSSAKYKNGHLISKKGRTPYSQLLELSDTAEFSTIVDTRHHVEHLAYRINDQFSVVVSSRTLQWNDYFIWFPYIFMLFFVLLLIFDKCYYGIDIATKQSLSSKIEHTVEGLLIVSFILIGIFGVIFIKSRNDRQQRYFLEEKMQAIAAEFTAVYKDYSQIGTYEKEGVVSMLTTLANVHSTDINIYDVQGNLYASSRPEIFNYRLVTEKLSPSAYNYLVCKNHSTISTRESVGNLSFISSYKSITNTQNHIIGFLNLPNFNKQDSLTQQFAGLIMAILNLLVIILFFATAISMFIAKRITDPLVVLQNKMKHVQVGSDNEKIDTNVPEELVGLVGNYNHMLEQLSDSAENLAKAERESAWREMARQIAHEIKNPLTPMKLSIQLLNRSWDEKDEKFEMRLKSISKTVIEQIDSLAETATSFSDFAKLSKVTLEPFAINDILLNCVTLFGQEDNVTITADIPEEPIIVVADKEKSMRLFNNILKNAIQAIPSEREGRVSVQLTQENQYAVVAVHDNGRGISEEARQHIFELHFTTKSTGSGFGLAICKTIVDSCHGFIWFESVPEEGTTFFVKLPMQEADF